MDRLGEAAGWVGDKLGGVAESISNSAVGRAVGSAREEVMGLFKDAAVNTFTDANPYQYGRSSGDPMAVEYARVTEERGAKLTGEMAVAMYAQIESAAVGIILDKGLGKVLEAFADRLPPIHHIATNKSKAWTKEFEAIFAKAGLTLDDAANLLPLPGHKGPHPQEYHMYIWLRLTAATDGLSGEAYERALRNELSALGQELLQQPDLVAPSGQVWR
jgi:hypothetical protein